MFLFEASSSIAALLAPLARYTFGIPKFTDGIGFVAIAMGVFGFADVITNLEKKEHREVFTNKITSLFPTKDDFKRMVVIMAGYPIVRLYYYKK
jgi:TctA family transporter